MVSLFTGCTCLFIGFVNNHTHTHTLALTSRHTMKSEIGKLDAGELRCWDNCEKPYGLKRKNILQCKQKTTMNGAHEHDTTVPIFLPNNGTTKSFLIKEASPIQTQAFPIYHHPPSVVEIRIRRHFLFLFSSFFFVSFGADSRQR